MEKETRPDFQSTILGVVWWAVNETLKELPDDSAKNDLFNLFYPLSGSIRSFDELNLDERFKHWMLYGGHTFEAATYHSGLSREEGLKQMEAVLHYYDIQIAFAKTCFCISKDVFNNQRRT